MYITDRHRQTVVTLKTHNSGLDRLDATYFLTLRQPCLGSDPYFVKHWARSKNQPLR